MTALRKLALNISGFVVRFASPGSRNWATATLSEIEFIEDDWTALRWALGSTLILLERTELPLSSLTDVPLAAVWLAREIRRRTVGGCLTCLIEAIWLGSFAHRTLDPVQRLGSYLLVGALLYMLIQLLARRGTMPLGGELSASPEVYRSELERQRDFHRNGWLWSRVIVIIPGFMLICLGEAIAHPASAHRSGMMAVVFLVLCTLAIPNNLRLARRYQRCIDDLDLVAKGEV
jgi:hypothetical protein